MAIIPALMPVIAEVTLDAAAASVEFKVPSGYEILFLEWHNVMGDDNSARAVRVTFNGDTGNNYDLSFVAFGTASSTVNATAFVQIAAIADADGLNRVSSGSAIIFNRTGTEKVVIGSDGRWDAADGSGTVNDFTGAHIESKWRTTSGVITSVTVTPAAGNFTAGSKFVLRGLRTDKAPALGSADIMQFIGSHEVSGTEASVTLPTVPAGYGMLLLFWHDVQGDDNAAQNILLTMAGGAGEYDTSHQAFGAASSTVNAQSALIIGTIADDDGVDRVSSGYALIFNRLAQEKVVIGASVYFDNSGGAGADDLIGTHFEGKDRTTDEEISSLTVAPAAGNFDAGKFWLVGLKIP